MGEVNSTGVSNPSFFRGISDAYDKTNPHVCDRAAIHHTWHSAAGAYKEARNMPGAAAEYDRANHHG